MILEVLPFAIGVFASPLPVIIAIVMLFTADPRRTSVLYVATWVGGLTVVTVAFTLFAEALGLGADPPAWAPWVRIGLGVALLALAVKVWLGRSSGSTPEWLEGLLQAGPREAFRFGVLMSAANPKELVMALAAGLAIGTSGAGVSASAAALVAFIVVGAASVAGPLVVFLVGGDATLKALTEARDWLQRNNNVVAAVVLGLLSVWLIVGGILKL